MRLPSGSFRRCLAGDPALCIPMCHGAPNPGFVRREWHRGAVAQLGERVVRNDEVRGSIPLGSTTHFVWPLVCGLPPANPTRWFRFEVSPLTSAIFSLAPVSRRSSAPTGRAKARAAVAALSTSLSSPPANPTRWFRFEVSPLTSAIFSLAPVSLRSTPPRGRAKARAAVAALSTSLPSPPANPIADMVQETEGCRFLARSRYLAVAALTKLHP